MMHDSAKQEPNRQGLSPDMSTPQVVGFLGGLVATSVVAAIVFWFGRHESSVRGVSGSLGTVAAVLNLGASLWSALRVRQWALAGMVVLSFPPAAIWVWVFYLHIVHPIR